MRIANVSAPSLSAALTGHFFSPPETDVSGRGDRYDDAAEVARYKSVVETAQRH